jgi:hypothetical protein
MPWTLSVYGTGAGESPDCTVAGCLKLAKHHVTARLTVDGVVTQSKYGRLCDQHLAEARAKCGVPAGPVVAPPAEAELPAAAAAPARKPPTYPIPDAASPTTCSCGETIVWVLTPNMKRCPVNAFGEHRGESHFAHCPHADAHRKPRDTKRRSA